MKDVAFILVSKIALTIITQSSCKTNLIVMISMS